MLIALIALLIACDPNIPPEDIADLYDESCEPASVVCHDAVDTWAWEDCGRILDNNGFPLDCDGWEDRFSCEWELPRRGTVIIDWYVPEDDCPAIVAYYDDMTEPK